MVADSPLLDGQPIHFNEASNTSASSFSNIEAPLTLDSHKLINWSSLNHIYSTISVYGGPSCILPTNSYFVLGTIKGALLIFNYKEFLQVILLPQTKDEIPSSAQTSLVNRFATSLHSKVMDIVMSYDGTHLAASYESGDIYLWNLNASTNKHHQLNTDDTSAESSSRRTLTPLSAILHITEHQGKEITGIDFMPNRHTGLVVSNVAGNVLYHNGHRTGLWNMTYSVKKLLIVPPNEVILNTKLNGDKLAILTNTKLGLISIKNNMQMTFEEEFESILTNTTTVPQNSMSWIGDNIAYSIKNKVTVYLNFGQQNTTKLLWNYTEPILLLQWLAPNLLGLLTVSHQLLIVNPTENFNVVMTIDLLIHDLLIPPNKHFRWYRNKLFLLTNYSFKVGKFVSWSSLLLKRVQRGDYIGALSLLNQFADKSFPIPTLLNLSIKPEIRKLQLKEPFNNLTFAALKFLLNNNKVESVEDLISTALQLQVDWFPNESKEAITQFLDITWETILQQSEDISKGLQEVFLQTINKLIESKTIQALSPMLFQATLQKYPTSLKTLILRLDKNSWDYDLLVRMCQEQHDVKTLIYIWNISFNDYLTPFVESIKWIRDGRLTHSVIFGNVDCQDGDHTECRPGFIFDYVISCYNDLQYPTEMTVDNPIQAYITKENISYMLFNGVDVSWPFDSNNKVTTIKLDGSNVNAQTDEPAFPYFKLFMHFNSFEFYSMLSKIMDNEFFDEEELDSNTIKDNQTAQFSSKIKRQHVMDILLTILKEEHGIIETSAKQYTVAYIGEFLTKYRKEIFVTNQELENILKEICDLSDDLIINNKTIEELIIDMLNIYVPNDSHLFIAKLKARNFKKALLSLYKKKRNYLDMIQLFLSDSKLDTSNKDDFKAIIDDACKSMDKSSVDFIKIKLLIKDDFKKILTALGVNDFVSIIQEVDPALHKTVIFSAISDDLKLGYLERYFTTGIDPKLLNPELKKSYIHLSCKLRKDQDLIQWIKSIEVDESDTSILIEDLSDLNNYEALSEVHHKMGNYSQEITILTKCIHEWFKMNDPDVAALNRYVSTSIGSILSIHDQKESYWIELVSCLMKEFYTYKDDMYKKTTCNNILQKVFVRLILIERKNGNNLYDILAGILDDNEITITKSKNLEALFRQIFLSFHLEEAISKTLLKIIQDSSLGMVSNYRKGLKEGWTIHNSECEICGKKLWGVGLSPDIFHQWENKQRGLESTSEELSDERIIVFKCCHGFHKRCLKNLGQTDSQYECLLDNFNTIDD